MQSLIAGTGCKNVYERCDELVRKGEGLPTVSGALAGDEPPDEVFVNESAGKKVSTDLKTGFRRTHRVL